jgi:cobalamin biosynthesis protein CbiG
LRAERLICWALTPRGAAVAREIAAALKAEIRLPRRLAEPGEQGFCRLAEALATEWPLAKGHIFVAAAGLVVRCMAPLLAHKDGDPAVVVCDQNGRFAISLLSGHLGGANDLACEVARLLGGTAVITTATDCADLPAFDLLAVRAGCSFADLNEVKAVSAALLAGADILVRDPLHVLDAAAMGPRCRVVEEDAATADCEVNISLSPLEPRPNLLRLHPRRIHAGVGCRRGVPGAIIERAVRQALSLARITPLALAGLASASVKTDEAGLDEAARALGVNLRCFSAATLAAVPVPHASAKAAEVLGVEQVGVCEAAALLSAGPGAGLLLPKHVYGNGGHGGSESDEPGAGLVTVALALER